MLTLYLSDRPSELNKDIILYINNNLGSIVKMGLYLNFVVAKPQDVQEFTQKGIVNFPTLTNQKNKYVGVDQIKGFFNNFHKIYQKKQASRTEKDDIQDYWSNILSKGEEEEEDDGVEQMKAAAQKAVQARQKKHQSNNPSKVNRNPIKSSSLPTEPSSYPSSQKGKKSNLEPSTLDVISSMKSSGQEAVDDELMAKFFENQSETSF